MSRFTLRRLHPVRTGVFVVLILSLILPHPARVVAQEGPLPETEPSVTTDDASTSVPANEPADENVTERALPEPSQASENHDQDQKPEAEEGPITTQTDSLTLSAGDPFQLRYAIHQKVLAQTSGAGLLYQQCRSKRK